MIEWFVITIGILAVGLLYAIAAYLSHIKKSLADAAPGSANLRDILIRLTEIRGELEHLNAQAVLQRRGEE